MNYDSNCGLFLLYLSDHINGDFELPQFEDVHDLPQYEDATDLPHYEVVTKLPSCKVVADLLWYGKTRVDLPLYEVGFKQASTSVLTNVLARFCISRFVLFDARRYIAKELAYHFVFKGSRLKNLLPQRTAYHHSVSSALVAEDVTLIPATLAAFLGELRLLSDHVDSLPLVTFLDSEVVVNELENSLHGIHCLELYFLPILICV